MQHRLLKTVLYNRKFLRWYGMKSENFFDDMDLLQRLERKIMEELDEADEALIKSITFHGSKDFVRRIDDNEDDDIDELGKASSSLSESSKRKIALEPLAKVEKATDYLTKRTLADYVKDGRKTRRISMKRKFIVKPRSALEVTKKPQIAREVSDPSNDEGARW